MFYGVKDIGMNLLGLSSHSDRLRKEEFWAIDDVSFEVKKGETLGIIGPNGSGKTTLLKMLNGIFWPDKGKITMEGEVGSLIEMGAGFHPLLTGRENIYINAAILGMNKKEVDEKFEDIIKFADIGDFIDAPVKFYSSGMFVRLGFAVAVHCEPDILLVDEVLAVGDRNFQIKCFQKINEIKRKGAAIILVSHSDSSIREQTQTALYLNHGRKEYLGESFKAIVRYNTDLLKQKESARVDKSHGFTSSKGSMTNITFYDENNIITNSIESGKQLKILLEIEFYDEIKKPIISVDFCSDNRYIFCANSWYDQIIFPNFKKGKIQISILILNFSLPENKYDCHYTISEVTNDNLIDWKTFNGFTVTGSAKARGSLFLPVKWELKENE
jgi:lipopolysaccharide transport system ATP-binding protein